MKRLICLLVLIATPSIADVYIRDADTIEVDGTPVRLQGIDAPETETPEGRIARQWMVEFLHGKDITCELTGETSYDRFIGVCFVDGVDLGQTVVSAGQALDCRRYSGGRYAQFETDEAKSQFERADFC